MCEVLGGSERPLGESGWVWEALLGNSGRLWEAVGDSLGGLWQALVLGDSGRPLGGSGLSVSLWKALGASGNPLGRLWGAPWGGSGTLRETLESSGTPLGGICQVSQASQTSQASWDPKCEYFIKNLNITTVLLTLSLKSLKKHRFYCRFEKWFRKVLIFHCAY